MRLVILILLVGILAVPGHALGQCRGLAAISGFSKDQLKSGLTSLPDTAKGSGCGSFLSVIGKLISRDVTGGRRLEKDRPFNPATAQANVDKAMRDLDVRKRIDALQTQVPDATVRLLHEAVIFDEEGFYDARELRIQQLRQRLN